MRKRLSFALLVFLLTIGGMSSVQAGPGGGEEEAATYALDSVWSPEIQLSRQSTGPGEDWYRPVVAYNSLRRSSIMFTHAHAATGGDVYGYYWSAIPDDWVWFWAASGVQPAVAYNRTDDDFLLVYMYDSDQSGQYEIWGTIVEGDASARGAPFLIFQWANRSFWSPRVAWNSVDNEYLVVWSAVDTTTGLPNDISAARVSKYGVVLAGAPHVITDQGTPHQPDVVYNPAHDQYLVVWARQGVGADKDIYGARLRGREAELLSPPGGFPINALPEDQRSPSVTTNGEDYYMVVWEHAFPGPCCDWDIRGQELFPNGTLSGGVVLIAQTLDDEVNPKVVARQGLQHDYLAVWQKDASLGAEIWASRWGDTGFTFFHVASAAWWNYASPDVAIAGSRYLFVYEGDSQGDPTVYRHIYGRQWAPYGVFLPIVLRNG